MNEDLAGNPRPRHCMVVHAYYPLGETRVQREAEALIARGYEVDVICLRGPGEAPLASHRAVRIHRLPVQRKRGGLLAQFLNYCHFFVLASIKLAQLNRRHPYATVQVHNLPDALVFCALIPKLQKRAVILDLHDLMPEFYSSRFERGARSFLGRLIRWQERAACRFADHVITVSHHWRDALAQRGVRPDRCSVVMNVADPAIFHPGAGGSPPDLPDTGFRLIYHGSVHERYGLDLAIRAVDCVRSELPGVHLTIIGSGDHLPTLKKLVEDLGLEGHVSFETDLPAEMLPDIIRTALAGVVPYRNDVFTGSLVPTKLMEYAAMGVPAIAARTPAIEAYFAGTMVEFFEPGSVDDLARCIRTLAVSPSRLAELALGAERFNERYNWESQGAAYVDLVQRLGKVSRVPSRAGLSAARIARDTS